MRVLVAALQGQAVTLTEQAQTLTARVAALEEQVRQSSRNLSRPPSSDPARGAAPRAGPLGAACERAARPRGARAGAAAARAGDRGGGRAPPGLPVLWRKRSLGTKTDTGSRAVERLLTVVTTCRQQQRDVLDYLTIACQAATLGSAPPSLVPAATPAPPPLSPAPARPTA